jgi:hypothetical protein
MRIRDIVGLVFAIAGLLIIGGLFDTGIDWVGGKFPNVMALFGFLVLTGLLLMFAYIAAGLTVNSYDKALKNYDLNRGAPVTDALVEKAHRRIADRVAWKFAIIAVGIFWICVLIRNCSDRMH